MSRSQSVRWLQSWGLRAPSKWEPDGTGFSGQYRTNAGVFNGWVGVTDRGVAALIDAAPRWVEAEPWDGTWSRLSVQGMEQTVARFKAKAQRFMEDRAMSRREFQASEVSEFGPMVIRKEKVKTDHAEIMRVMNEGLQFQAQVQTQVGAVTDLVRSLSEHMRTHETQYASTIAAIPERVAELLKRQRDFYWRATKGNRFWSFGLAGQASAEWAMAKATQDMRNFLYDMEHMLAKQFNALLQLSAQHRMMFVHAVAQAFGPLLTSGQPQTNSMQQLFQRLLVPSTNGAP